MSYKTSRAMTLMGRSFKKGDVVSEHVLAEIPDGRLRSLKNTGMLRKVEFEEIKPPESESPQPEPETTVEEPQGDHCPECGKGPYKRLDRHMTTHEGA